jgi:hypothetical protein
MVEFFISFLRSTLASGRHRPGLAADSGCGCSRCLEVAVVPVRLQVESPCHPDTTVPCPGAVRERGRARSFAEHGISVVCLAISKGKSDGESFCKRRGREKQLGISGLRDQDGVGGLTGVVSGAGLAGFRLVEGAFAPALRDGRFVLSRADPGLRPPRRTPAWAILAASRPGGVPVVRLADVVNVPRGVRARTPARQPVWRPALPPRRCAASGSGLARDEAAAANLVVSTSYSGYGLGVGEVLFGEDPGGQ